MLIRSVVASLFDTNCWIIATGKGAECIIVDPGMPDVTAEVQMVIEEEGLKPVATLLTHGHLDHTFSVKPLADGYGIPAYIHPEDRRYIADPAPIIGADFVAQLANLNFEEPIQVEYLKEGSILDFVGLSIKAIHAPGHTKGSLMFLINDELLLSGDVFFKGSIGRTDLASGSASEMRETLIKKVLTLDDDIHVLPGHYGETTIKYERKNNPYLKQLS